MDRARITTLLALLALLAAFAACDDGASSPTDTATGGDTADATGDAQSGSLALSGPDFGSDLTYPEGSVCPNTTSPALTWSGAPGGTASFAVIMHAPPDDTLHPFKWWWMLYDIPASVSSLDAGGTGGGTLGTNNVHMEAVEPGFEPPCPNDTEPHTVVITLYALSGSPAVADPTTVTYDEMTSALAPLTLDSVDVYLTLQRDSVGPPN